MFIPCDRVRPGASPEDVVVRVRGEGGHTEEVPVDRSLVREGFLDVGPAVVEHDDRILVELPRAAASGIWRMWITKAEMIDD